MGSLHACVSCPGYQKINRRLFLPGSIFDRDKRSECGLSMSGHPDTEEAMISEVFLMQENGNRFTASTAFLFSASCPFTYYKKLSTLSSDVLESAIKKKPPGWPLSPMTLSVMLLQQLDYCAVKLRIFSVDKILCLFINAWELTLQ